MDINFNAKETIDKIKDYFKEIRDTHSETTNDSLYEDGKIYYMNGNDGTDFDWKINVTKFQQKYYLQES